MKLERNTTIALAAALTLATICARTDNPPKSVLQTIIEPIPTTLVIPTPASPVFIATPTPHRALLPDLPPTPEPQRVFKSNILGVRTNVAYYKNVDLMGMIANETPFSRVRVSIEEGLDITPETKRVLLEAKRLNLDILVVFNPKKLINEHEIQKRLKNLLDLLPGYKKRITVEAGNEADNKNVDQNEDGRPSFYWENADMVTYGIFNARVERVANELGINMAVGSLENPIDHTRTFIQAFRNARGNNDLSPLTFTYHAYGGKIDVRERVSFIRKEVGNEAALVASEIGQEDPIVLMEMVDEAHDLKTTLIYFHEFPPFNWGGLTSEYKGVLVVKPVVSQLTNWAKTRNVAQR